MIYSKPLVSIAMVTCNGSDYVGNQLRSILNQTYPNIELVITDDASSDGTLAILYTFKTRFNNIKIFNSPTTLGITSCFENSIKKCHGEFIALSGQDDIWELNKIETLLNEIKDEDVIYSDSELIDKNDKPLHRLISSCINLGSFKSGAPFLMDTSLPGQTMLMQGDFARYILPIPGVIMYDRWICFCAAANNGITYVNQPLIKYRHAETDDLITGKRKYLKISKTDKEKYYLKLLELKACERAPVKDTETKKILQEMLSLFTPKISLARSIFFFRNRNMLLSVKMKSRFRQMLYCLEMFFKANY
jgi:glycosyltransferase involved in cell wall biosynthesis